MPGARLNPRRRRTAAVSAIACVALVLVGCSRPGAVDNYNDDTAENFRRACVEANDPGLSDEEARARCQCWYDAITENMSFEAFERADEAIRQGLEDGSVRNADDLRNNQSADVREFYEIVTQNCVETGPRAG
ncbi:MAG TPA: hypothetical protein VF183_15695 [Acidimicrobiales bacterium]